MVSQFISSHPVRLLGHLNYSFPEGIHAIGRLDCHSEGLLLLTTNSKVTKLLFEGKKKHKRTYQVMVLHIVNEETVKQLQTGVTFKARGGDMYTTTPCDVTIIDEPNFIFPSPYIKSPYQQYSWLQITLTEGKYRQVRKMVAAVGHRCVRLIRTSIEDANIDGMQAGEVKEINEKSFFEMLKIDY
jgi:23S rRNA pseudouridine2457 synthase